MASIAETWVTVMPETAKVAAGIRAVFRELDKDAREAGRRWGREIEQGLGEAKVKLSADTAKARAELDEATKDRHSTVHVDVDKDRLGSTLASAVEDAGPKASAAAANAGTSIGASMGSALSAALMPAGIAALGGIASAASGLAGLAPAGLAGAGTSIATLVVGLNGVKDAYDAVSKAALSSGQDQYQQQEKIAAATRSLRDATASEAQAQKDVALARRDARQQLQDLNLELRGGAINEKQAQLDALKARQDLMTGTYKTSLDYEQAQLRVVEADQRVAEAHDRNIKLGQKAADERAKGVDNADQVVSANERLTRSHESVTAAQQSLHDATTQGSSAAKDAAKAMGLLSPNAQQFVNTLMAIKPAFQDFQNSVQDSLFAGIGPQIQQLADTYLPILTSALSRMASLMNQAFSGVAKLLQSPQMLSMISTIFDNINKSFQPFMPSINPMIQAFTKLTEGGSSFLPQLADGAVKAAQGFANFIDKASQSGQLQQWIQTGIDTMNQLWPIVQTLGKMFLDLAPIGTAVLNALKPILDALAPAIKPLADLFASFINANSPMLTFIANLATSIITSLAPALTTWFREMAPIAQQMVPFLFRILKDLQPVLSQVAGTLATSMVKAAKDLVPVLIPFVDQMTKLLVSVFPLIPPLVDLAMTALPSITAALKIILPFMTDFVGLINKQGSVEIPLLVKAVKILSDAFKTAWTLISSEVSNAWKLMKPIFDVMKIVFDTVLKPIGDMIDKVAGAISKIPGVSSIVGALAPVFAGSPGAPLDPATGALPNLGTPGASGPSFYSGWYPAATTPSIPGMGLATGQAGPPGPGFTYAATPQGVQAATTLAQQASGKPYSYGGTGPLYDCSGFMSTLFATMTGRPVSGRYFTTESDLTQLGFQQTSAPVPGAFNVGIHQGGGGMSSHMAGTLPNGVNVESGGAANMTQYGGTAAGAWSPQFEKHYFLPVGGAPAPPIAAAYPAGTPPVNASQYAAPGVSPAAAPAPLTAQSSKRDRQLAIIAKGKQLGLSDAEIQGILGIAEEETNFQSPGFMGFQNVTPNGYTAGANFSQNPQAALDQFFTNYMAGGKGSTGPTKAQAVGPGGQIADQNTWINFLWHRMQAAEDPNYGPKLQRAIANQTGEYPGLASQVQQPTGSSVTPAGTPQDPMYMALSPNIPPGQQAGPGGANGMQQLGQNLGPDMLQMLGMDGTLFKDPTQFGIVKLFSGLVNGLLGIKIPTQAMMGGDGASQFNPGGGGGGGFGGLLSGILQPFGNLTVGSPQNAPGQFMPAMPGSTASGLLTSPLAPPGAPGPGNAPIDNSMTVINNGVNPNDMMSHLSAAQNARTRQPLRHVP